MALQNSPARSPVDVGSVIADTYTIEAMIGRGGMGAVFLASHNRLPGKKVAIKMLHAEISDPETLARFKREAQIASLLGHPNIVGVENFDVLPDGTPYLVLEYLQGETLAQRLQSGPLPTETIFSIVRQVGSALQAAHRAGVVHRDLKPQNIFLVPTEIDGHAFEQAKVLDFGISKMRGSQTVKTQESALLGTPQYMAPEQATGKHDLVDERTDIFALGAIVYEMIAGHPAFVGASIPEVVFKVVYEQPTPLAQEVPSVAPNIASAVQQALSKSQSERFSTINGFVEALTGKSLPPTKTGGSIPPVDARTPTPARSTGNDAFAATVGSGDHSGSMPVAPAAPPVRGSAPTVSSQSGAPVAAAVATVVPKRSRAPIIVGCIAGAAIVSGAVFFVMRGSGEEPREQKVHEPKVAVHETPSPTPPPTPTPTPTPPPPPTPTPTPPPKPTATPPPTPTPPPKPAVVEKKPEPPPTPPAGEERDPVAKQHLADAEQAIEGENWARAKELAHKVTNSPDASDFQKQRAHAMIGVASCHANNDQEGAQRELRQISMPKLKNRVIAACRENGVAITPD